MPFTLPVPQPSNEADEEPEPQPSIEAEETSLPDTEPQPQPTIEAEEEPAPQPTIEEEEPTSLPNTAPTTTPTPPLIEEPTVQPEPVLEQPTQQAPILEPETIQQPIQQAPIPQPIPQPETEPIQPEAVPLDQLNIQRETLTPISNPNGNLIIKPVLPQQFPDGPTIMKVEESPQTVSESTNPAPQPQHCQCLAKPNRNFPRARW